MMNATVLSQNAQISANQDIKRTGIKVIEDILSSLLNGNSVCLPYTYHGVSEIDEKLYMVVVIPGNIEIYEPRIIDDYSSSYLDIMHIGVPRNFILNNNMKIFGLCSFIAFSSYFMMTYKLLDTFSPFYFVGSILFLLALILPLIEVG